jgi:aspartate kinase
MRGFKAGGIIKNVNLAKIGLRSVPNRPGIAGKIFIELGKRGINVQFIVQDIEISDKANMTFCVSKNDMEAALSVIKKVNSEVQAEKITSQTDIAIVSIYGPHFRDYPGIAGMVFFTLASVDINILAISTSISAVSCVIEEDRINDAVNALKESFDLPPNSVFTTSQGVSLRLKADQDEE